MRRPQLLSDDCRHPFICWSGQPSAWNAAIRRDSEPLLDQRELKRPAPKMPANFTDITGDLVMPALAHGLEGVVAKRLMVGDTGRWPWLDQRSASRHRPKGSPHNDIAPAVDAGRYDAPSATNLTGRWGY